MTTELWRMSAIDLAAAIRKREVSSREVVQAHLDRIARAWSQFHAEYPIVIGPVATQQPFAVGVDATDKEKLNEFIRSLRLVVTANLLGLPAAVVPVGVSDGLPQSVQIITNLYREDVAFDAAETIEARAGVITPIDPR